MIIFSCGSLDLLFFLACCLPFHLSFFEDNIIFLLTEMNRFLYFYCECKLCVRLKIEKNKHFLDIYNACNFYPKPRLHKCDGCFGGKG